MTDLEILAKIGLFFIAILGYALITCVAGLNWTAGDTDSFAPPAWFVGGLMYAITVVLMWQG